MLSFVLLTFIYMYTVNRFSYYVNAFWYPTLIKVKTTQTIQLKAEVYIKKWGYTSNKVYVDTI
jgi:hypothetical protein